MPWRKHALVLAKQIRAEDPSKHILNVASEISSRWQHDTERCPGTGKLIRAIRECQEQGKLARPPKKGPSAAPGHVGGCGSASRCCEPGDGTEGCRVCAGHQGCP